MKVADRLRLEPARESYRLGGGTIPARLALIADDGEELDAIPLAELAKVLAPFIAAELVVGGAS